MLRTLFCIFFCKKQAKSFVFNFLFRSGVLLKPQRAVFGAEE
jgi:hypothetical protein